MVCYDEVPVLKRIARHLTSAKRSSQSWGNAKKVDDGVFKCLQSQVQPLRSSTNRWYKESLCEVFWQCVRARLIAVTRKRFTLRRLPAKCCPGTSQPYALYGRACKAAMSARVKSASAKKLCDKAQSKHQAFVRAYKARSLAHFPSLRGDGLRLSDNRVRNLVPEAGPFGRYQVLTDFRALTSAQLVDLPDFFGHGASCGGTVLRAHDADRLCAGLNRSGVFRACFGGRIRSEQCGHLLCEVRQAIFAGCSSHTVESFFNEWALSGSSPARPSRPAIAEKMDLCRAVAKYSSTPFAAPA